MKTLMAQRHLAQSLKYEAIQVSPIYPCVIVVICPGTYPSIHPFTFGPISQHIVKLAWA